MSYDRTAVRKKGDPTMDATLLSLPWQIQFGAAAGYASYALAYIGIRSHHQTIDVAFRTLVFSAIATFVLNIVLAGAGPAWGAGIALFASLTAAFVWRGVGRGVVRTVLQAAQFSMADDEPSAFSRIYADTKHRVTQAIVTLDDGSELHCDDTSAFANAAIFPFSIGPDGSVAIYATRMCVPDPDGTVREFEYKTVLDADWGDRMTLVPASRVRHVELRFKPI